MQTGSVRCAARPMSSTVALLLSMRTVPGNLPDLRVKRTSAIRQYLPCLFPTM